MMQRERSDVYIIPPNFAKEGTLFSGRIEGRNAFEAAVLFIILFRILLFLDVSIKIRIYIGIIVILPLTILAVVGVNGESLLSFIIQFIRFVTRRRVVTVPDGQYRLKRNRRIRRQQKKRNILFALCYAVKEKSMTFCMCQRMRYRLPTICLPGR